MSEDFKKVDSSNVSGVKYDSDHQILTVQFKNSGTYEYTNVEQNVADELMQADSIGQYFHQNIKGKYPSRNVIETGPLSTPVVDSAGNPHPMEAATSTDVIKDDDSEEKMETGLQDMAGKQPKESVETADAQTEEPASDKPASDKPASDKPALKRLNINMSVLVNEDTKDESVKGWLNNFPWAQSNPEVAIQTETE